MRRGPRDCFGFSLQLHQDAEIALSLMYIETRISQRGSIRGSAVFLRDTINLVAKVIKEELRKELEKLSN